MTSLADLPDDKVVVGLQLISASGNEGFVVRTYNNSPVVGGYAMGIELKFGDRLPFKLPKFVCDHITVKETQ